MALTRSQAIPIGILVLAGAVIALVLLSPALANPWGDRKLARIQLPRAAAYDAPQIAGDAAPDKPLVMIDAGHGGFDYGARADGFDEKTVVLGLAKALRDRLLADGRVRVAMTRDDDSFVTLTERFRIARRSGAALFVSIHADSAAVRGATADAVTGASIYTLSNDASSAAARRFANRENAAGRINGQDLAGQSDTVASILVDLSQRRTQAQSEKLAELIEREGQGIVAFHEQPRRKAALEVLKAPDVPSVLFESGYITNPTEAARLSSAEGRRAFATVMARAIRLYFASERADAAPQPSPIASAAAAP